MRRQSIGSTASSRRQTFSRALKLEHLERRLVLTSLTLEQALGQLSSHGVCTCPVCTGELLSAIPAQQAPASGPSAAPLSALPQLHSNPSAAAKLFLDFDGHFESSWGGDLNVSTPAFSQDGDVTTFTSGELTAIEEIWARVSEDFAPFNIDVTTVDPGNQTDEVTAVIAIGGGYDDWFDSPAGGVAYIGGFYNDAPNVGYVFEDDLSSHPRYIAEASSHEAGHLFGLLHQALWSGGTLVEEYNPGNASWAPIMGNSYSSARSTWHNGATDVGSSSFQHDIAVIANASNGFGQRADDYGNTIAFAADLPAAGTEVNLTGIIERNADVDMWEFTTSGGSVSFALSVAPFGPNLDAILELRSSSNTILNSSAPTNSFGASLNATLAAGTYYLAARGNGVYGNIGQYSIAGTVPAGPQPEIGIDVAGSGISDGGALDFGTTIAGKPLDRTLTVTNTGDGTLTLTSLDPQAMPVGFSIVSNLGSMSLAPSESTAFSIRLDAASAGSYSGQLLLVSDDSDESPYNVNLSGVVTAQPEISMFAEGSGIGDGVFVNYGLTGVGAPLTRTFTVRNDGGNTLDLAALDANAMPAGFTLTSNLSALSLANGETASFDVRLDAASAGSFSGQIEVLSNDGNESPFQINVLGTVGVPEISMFAGASGIGDGVYIGYGSTGVGSPLTTTYTVRNDGGGTLNLAPLDAGGMPAGFTLTSNLSSLVLVNGQTATFTVQLDADAVGPYSGQIQVVSNDSNESPFRINLLGNVHGAPEIAVTVSGNSIADGGLASFGSTTVGNAATRTFTVTNAGSETLSLSALDSNAMPAGFTLLSNLGSTSLAPGASTTFAVQLDATAAGSYSGAIALANNDANENPFDITVSGTVTDPDAWGGRQIVDNGGSGWSRIGPWTLVNGKGREEDIHRTGKGSGSVQSNWTFNNLPEGQYWVWASWTANANNASNAPFAVYDGTTAKATWRVDQRTASSGFDADGTSWQYLGMVTINSGQMVVRLSNAANNFVVADAIRMDRAVTQPALTPRDQYFAQVQQFAPPAAHAQVASLIDFLARERRR